MPNQFKAARLWSVVAAALLIAGMVSAMGGGAQGAAAQTVSLSAAI